MKDKLLAIDPGTRKCGIAVLHPDGTALEKRVAPLEGLKNELEDIFGRRDDIDAVVVGSGTGSAKVIEIIRSIGAAPGSIEKIQERNTTLDARKLYEKDHPRPWPLRMLPFGLFGLPDGMDAYAAVAIGLLYLESIRRKDV